MNALKSLLLFTQEAFRRKQAVTRVLQRWAWWGAGVVALLVLSWLNPAFVQRLDLLAYDVLVPTRPAMDQSPVLIAIDDASLAELGRWPWSRARHAEMIDRLGEAGAAAIGMGVLFSEPDLDDPASDAALAAAITRYGRLVLPVAPSQQPDAHKSDASPFFASLMPAGGASRTALGHVDVEMDMDGQARRLYLQAGYGRAEWPAMAVAVRQQVDPVLDITQLPGVRPNRRAHQDATLWVRDREVLLPRMQSLPTLSFASVLHAPKQLALVRGRAVFIGVTATGLGGELVTPLVGRQSTLSAVEFHAQAYAALVQQSLMQRAPPLLSLLLALLMLASMALWSGSEGRRVLLAVSMLGLPLLISAILLHTTRQWVAPAVTTLSLGVALIGWLAAKFQQVLRQLRRSRQYAQDTLTAIADAVITIDVKQRMVQSANPSAVWFSATGHPLGQPWRQAYPLMDDGQARLDVALDECLRHHHRIELPDYCRLYSPNSGTTRALRIVVSPLCNLDGQLDGAVLVFSDVTDAVSATRELHHAATHDLLTDLPNRVLLHKRLVTTLERIERNGKSAAILFLGLDRFKYINDSIGHLAGDEVIKIVALRLRRLCRETDTVARWGGDQFVIVLEDARDQAGATHVAIKVIDALTQDVVLDEGFGSQRLPCSGSVGISMLPQDGADIDDLLSKADMAMHRAKIHPQASYQFWSEELNIRRRERLALEIDIRNGLRDQQFVLHYQPQFRLHDQRLVGMEALIRWQRSPDILVSPAGFIDVAEETGLIIDMGSWVVMQAARQVAHWLAEGLDPVPVAVNVSARQCLNHDVVAVVRKALKETRIPPALLRLEITESAAMADADHVIDLLMAIHALGVGLAVDDFGTGYSSLSYLKRFPIDELKIDKSFVDGVATNNNDAAIVRATIALAHGLGLKVVAEGVETEEQSRFLSSLNCDIAQGYLFSRPLPLVAATELLNHRRRTPAAS